MLPGKPTKLTCPYCGKPKYIKSLLSGNTFGERMWSDTKRDYPMWRSTSPVQRCPHCGKYYFHEDSNPLNYGSVKDFQKAKWLFPEMTGFDVKLTVDKDRERKRMEEIEREAFENGFGELSFEEMDEAFKALYPTAVEDRKRTLLLMWLISYNDVFGGRQQKPGPECPEDVVERHLYVIDELCQRLTDRLVLAELHREAGRFEECLKIIGDPIEDNPFLEHAVRQQIIAKAKQGETVVFELNTSLR